MLLEGKSKVGRKHKPNRQGWSKIYVPAPLADMIHMIARKHGYDPTTTHLFIYRLLKAQHGEEVERLADYLETRWLDDDSPPSA